MESKEHLQKSVKEWVKLDNEINVLQNEINSRKEEKKKYSKDIMEVMKTHNIDLFATPNDGQISYKKQQIKKPITQKLLFEVLPQFYKGEEEKATEIMDFINQNRGLTVRENISRRV